MGPDDLDSDLLEIFELIVTALALLGSLYIIICYLRLLQIHGRQICCFNFFPLINFRPVTWRAYLEVVFCISISDFLMAINYCFPFFLGFVLSETLLNQYQEEGWPWYAYFDVPFGFFSGLSAWLWLAFLPDAMRWTAFGEAPAPSKKIRRLHVIWLVSCIYAAVQSIIIFMVEAHLALIIRAVVMDFVGLLVVCLALGKYAVFYQLTLTLAVSEEERSRFTYGLVRRAAYYLAPYVLLWVPTYIFTTICAFKECSTNVVRLTNLVNGLQGFAHAIVFWKAEKIHELYHGKRYTEVDSGVSSEPAGAYTLLEQLANGKLLRTESSFHPPWEVQDQQQIQDESSSL